MKVLDRPPTDLDREDLGLPVGLGGPGDEPTVPDAPAHEAGPSSAPLTEDADGSGYAMKFARRRKAKGAAAIAAERKAAQMQALAKKARGRALWLAMSLLVPGLLLVGVLTMLGRGAGERVALPKTLEPAAFAGLLEFSETDRVGTLFQAKLRSSPSAEPAAHADFRSRVDTIAATLATEGYEALLIMGPDGTTFASGSVRSVSFAAAGAQGT